MVSQGSNTTCLLFTPSRSLSLHPLQTANLTQLLPRQGGANGATAQLSLVFASMACTPTMTSSPTGPAAVSASVSKSAVSASSASASLALNAITQGSGSGHTGGTSSTTGSGAKVNVGWAWALVVGTVAGVTAVL